MESEGIRRRRSDPVQYIKNSIRSSSKKIEKKEERERWVDTFEPDKDEESSYENSYQELIKLVKELNPSMSYINYQQTPARKNHDEHRLGHKDKTRGDNNNNKEEKKRPSRKSDVKKKGEYHNHNNKIDNKPTEPTIPRQKSVVKSPNSTPRSKGGDHQSEHSQHSHTSSKKLWNQREQSGSEKSSSSSLTRSKSEPKRPKLASRREDDSVIRNHNIKTPVSQQQDHRKSNNNVAPQLMAMANIASPIHRLVNVQKSWQDFQQLLTREFNLLAQDYAYELEKVRNERNQIQAQIKTTDALIQLQTQENERLNRIKSDNKKIIDALTTENEKLRKHIELKKSDK
jgi:hypothetical protein